MKGRVVGVKCDHCKKPQGILDVIENGTSHIMHLNFVCNDCMTTNGEEWAKTYDFDYKIKIDAAKQSLVE
ncbi:MAG: hypothetical protein AABY22_30365 [Nanoarchaeota archaeon]